VTESIGLPGVFKFNGISNWRFKYYSDSLRNKSMRSIQIYGLECFALTKSDLKSLDFAVNRFLMKLFQSNNNEIIAECRRYFQFNLPSKLIEKKEN